MSNFTTGQGLFGATSNRNKNPTPSMPGAASAASASTFVNLGANTTNSAAFGSPGTSAGTGNMPGGGGTTSGTTGASPFANPGAKTTNSSVFGGPGSSTGAGNTPGSGGTTSGITGGVFGTGGGAFGGGWDTGVTAPTLAGAGADTGTASAFSGGLFGGVHASYSLFMELSYLNYHLAKPVTTTAATGAATGSSPFPNASSNTGTFGTTLGGLFENTTNTNTTTTGGVRELTTHEFGFLKWTLFVYSSSLVILS